MVEGVGDVRVPRDVLIVHLTGPTFAALARGDLAEADRISPVPLSAFLAGLECQPVWRRRARQAEEDPDSPAWVTGVIWDPRDEVAVGRAGYHGPPDDRGTVEVGYAVDPRYRRRGYARAALEELLARAAREPLVRTVRASIRPDNSPSSLLVAQYGFRKVGERWDDEDGLEVVYEVAAGHAHSAPVDDQGQPGR
jgi:RimJ/RimL family protein N-acetyltransferase